MATEPAKKSVNASHVFWGVFFILAGLLLLMAKLDLLSVELGSVWKFWPVVLILWGTGVLARTRMLKIVAAVTAAILLALFIYEGVRVWVFEQDSKEITSQKIVQTYEGTVHRASLRFSSGAGKFSLSDTCGDLFRATTETTFGRYELERGTGSEREELSMKLVGKDNHISIHGGKNTVEMKLHPEPVWDLEFEIGAARADLDLSRFAVENLRVECGAGDMRLTLGDRASECAVNIQAGVSSLRIRVPESAGCELHVQAPLSSKGFRGFESKGKGVYTTSNAASASQRITMVIEAGVSRIRVERY